MAKRVIEIELISDASKLVTGFDKGDAAAAKFGKSADSSGSKWSKFGTIAKGAALGGIGALVTGLKGSVSAARDAQVSQTGMETQLKALDISYKGHAKEIDNVIQKTSKLAGVDDEDLQGAFTGIVRTTGNVSEALKQTALAADIMRGKHLDAAAAGKVLEKVNNGQFTALKKLGIAFEPVTTAQDALKASTKNATDEQIAAAKAADQTASKQGALAALQTKFGGQAEAYGKTAAGAQDRFKVAVENLQESIGAGLLPVITKLTNGVVEVVGWFEKNKTAAVGLGVGLGALGGAIVALKIANFAKDISGLVTLIRNWTGVQAALNVVMTANPVLLVVAAVAALSAGMYLAYTRSETFREGADKLFSVLRLGATGPIVLMQRALDVLAGALSTLLSGLGKIPGFGWADTAAKKIDRAREVTRNLANQIAGLPSHKSVNVDISATIPDSLRDLIISNPRGNRLVDHKAAGGWSAGGLTVVGEEGPELVNLPRGSYVHTAAQTRARAGGAGQTVNFYGPVGSQRAARAAAEQLAYRLQFGTA